MSKEVTPQLLKGLSKPQLAKQIAEVANDILHYHAISHGDATIPVWGNADLARKNSLIAGVTTVMCNPDITSEEIHNRWMEDMTNWGWTYGEVKDSDTKTHPCILPYSELDISHQVKDSIFLTTVKSIIRLVDEHSVS